MEAMLLSGKKFGPGGPWNGVIPSQDAKTIFRLANFSSVSDIKDRSPNTIAVTVNGNVPVGTNASGTFINFVGSGSWLSFSSALLNGNNYDIKTIIEYPVFPGGMYGASILDGRPNQTNGNYLSIFYPPTAPFKIIPYYNATEGPSTSSILQQNFPCVLLIKVRPSYIEIFANDLLVGRWDNTFNFVDNAVFKIARHAYSNVVADAVFKMYYFEIRKP